MKKSVFAIIALALYTQKRNKLISRFDKFKIGGRKQNGVIGNPYPFQLTKDNVLSLIWKIDDRNFRHFI